MLHWRYELPCQDKLPELNYTPILGCIRVLWLVFHPLGLELDKALFGWNSVTRNYMEAMQFDSENKNSKWYDAIKLEMESMSEYEVFKKWDKAILDKHKKVTNPPRGYHRIKVHLVFAVKFDGRHKARLVADGHLTPEPIENIYSGVVSLRNLRLVIFQGKLNNLELWGADIGNVYLEAFTDEKLYIVAGPEFQELEGYITEKYP